MHLKQNSTNSYLLYVSAQASFCPSIKIIHVIKGIVLDPEVILVVNIWMCVLMQVSCGHC